MVKYDESSIQSLDWKDHIRKRPGMYIGKLGDGNQVDDGIYVLVKEIIDNSIDEHVMGFGKRIELTAEFPWANWWTVFPRSTLVESTIQRPSKSPLD
jgi:DNA gyrase/topoisomerase IV subunit B